MVYKWEKEFKEEQRGAKKLYYYNNMPTVPLVKDFVRFVLYHLALFLYHC